MTARRCVQDCNGSSTQPCHWSDGVEYTKKNAVTSANNQGVVQEALLRTRSARVIRALNASPDLIQRLEIVLATPGDHSGDNRYKCSALAHTS